LSEVLLEEVNEEITELPMPNEPTFSITEPGIMVEQNNAHDFVINFDIEGNHEWKLKLSVSEILTITGVTGDVADYNAATGELVFSTVPAVVNVTVTSSEAQTGTLYAVYDEEDFWKVNNIFIYNSCGPTYQSFIGLTQKEIEKPFREASATWIGTLPVTFARFDVEEMEDHVQINWSTTTEKDNRGFEVQKSVKGMQWKTLGFVDSQSSQEISNGEIIYQFSDRHPRQGYNYYRLKQLDLDGTFSYSPIRRIYFESIDTPITVSPNPVSSGRAKIQITGESHPFVSIYNSLGIEVSKGKAIDGELNLHQLTSGIYLVKATDSHGNIYRKTIIVR